MPSVLELLVKKNLNLHLFDNKFAVGLEMPIEVHVAWVYRGIYSLPYPNGLERSTHGIQHVTRAAIYISIFANLYKHFGDKEALGLDDEAIKLLQIAALFHDSARENDEVDHWDQESALFFYLYARDILNLAPSKAKLLAEAIANKDADTKNYFELLAGAWVKRKGDSPKNIHQKLIHDADCLEIIRARDQFDAKYLDFYKDIAQYNDEALDLMAKLITEARSLITNQGDARGRLNFHIKFKYDHEDAYRAIIGFIKHENNRALYPLLIALSNNKSNSAVLEKTWGLTEDTFTKAMRLGKLFARGIGSPSAFYKRRMKEDEFAAAVEIRKMKRVPGIPTRTRKYNKRKKFGNPNRSISMMGYGAGVYANQGFLILEPKAEHINDLSVTDADSGRGKKKYRKKYSVQVVQEKLKDLQRVLKMGGYYLEKYRTTHNEILYRITDAQAIYFTQDPTLHNHIMYGNHSPCNRHTHYLQALFIQTEYQKATGILLPIYEYSGVHNFIKEVPNYSEEEIVTMWVEIASKLIIQNINIKAHYLESLEALKIKAIDGYLIIKNGIIYEHNFIKKQVALDLNYSKGLQEKINRALEEEKIKYLILSIKDGMDLHYWFDHSLDQINSKERDTILAQLEGRLGALINEEYQLFYLFRFPLDKLNAQQREGILRGVEPNLRTFIYDIHKMRDWFDFPLEKINSSQRDLILSSIKGRLGNMITNANHLLYLFSLPEQKLTTLQRDYIVTVLEADLGNLFKYKNGLINLFRLPLDKLNMQLRERILVALDGKFGDIGAMEYGTVPINRVSVVAFEPKIARNGFFIPTKPALIPETASSSKTAYGCCTIM